MGYERGFDDGAGPGNPEIIAEDRARVRLFVGLRGANKECDGCGNRGLDGRAGLPGWIAGLRLLDDHGGVDTLRGCSGQGDGDGNCVGAGTGGVAQASATGECPGAGKEQNSDEPEIAWARLPDSDHSGMPQKTSAREHRSFRRRLARCPGSTDQWRSRCWLPVESGRVAALRNMKPGRLTEARPRAGSWRCGPLGECLHSMAWRPRLLGQARSWISGKLH